MKYIHITSKFRDTATLRVQRCSTRIPTNAHLSHPIVSNLVETFWKHKLAILQLSGATFDHLESTADLVLTTALHAAPKPNGHRAVNAAARINGISLP